MLSVAGLAVAPANAEPPPLDAYGDLPGVEGMSISPSGDNLAIAGDFQGQRQLLVLDGERKLRLMMPLGESKLRDIEFVGEDTVVMLTSFTEVLGPRFNIDRFESVMATIVDVKERKAEQAYSRTASVAGSIIGDYGIRNIDGEWHGFFGGIELVRTTFPIEYVFVHGRPSLYQVDLASNEARKVANAAPPDHWREWLIDGNGEVGAFLEMNGKTGEWEISDGDGRRITRGIDLTGDVSLIAFTPDGSGVVFWSEDDANQTQMWYEVPLKGGEPVPFLPDRGIDQPFIDETNGRLLGYLESGLNPKAVFLDPVHDELMGLLRAAFPGKDIGLIDWTPEFHRALVHTSGNGDAGTWFYVDLEKLTADAVGRDRPLIPSSEVGLVSTVHYTAGDGLELDGILTLPPGREAKGLPVIILPHGGPGSYDTERFDWWAQAFASRGYAVLQPNFRGSTHRTEEFERAGNGEWGRKMQSDLSDGLAFLAAQGIVDPGRACIMGGSYGGFAALAGVTIQNGLYRCAVAVAPVADLELFNREGRRAGAGQRVFRLDRLESIGDPRRLEEVSPRRHASSADAPILLIHGKDDSVVPFRHSKGMADALKDAGKPYRLVELEGEDHWLSRGETRKQMLREAMAFVLEHNPPD